MGYDYGSPGALTFLSRKLGLLKKAIGNTVWVVQHGLPVQGTVGDIFHGAARTHVAASFAVGRLEGRNHLHAIYVAKDGAPLIGVTPDTVFDVGGFDQLDVCIFLRGRNANQPRSQFAR
jgi:hypothetical protein